MEISFPSTTVIASLNLRICCFTFSVSEIWMSGRTWYRVIQYVHMPIVNGTQVIDTNHIINRYLSFVETPSDFCLYLEYPPLPLQLHLLCKTNLVVFASISYRSSTGAKLHRFFDLKLQFSLRFRDGEAFFRNETVLMISFKYMFDILCIL